MLVYFDSSALVKLLVEEAGSDLATNLWNGCDAAISSRLAYPEVPAALAAAGRSRRLRRVDEQRALAGWEGYWAALRVVELTDEVATHAGQLTRTLALRGADAVHLASALALGASVTVFAVWDERLRAGAQAAGIDVAPFR